MTGRALYLAGGGARGAYQAGVMKAIAEITQAKTIPFDIISSVSVGSINAAMLAQYADDFAGGVETLEAMWRSLHCRDVFEASNWALIKSVLKNIFFFLPGTKRPSYLLNTHPLKKLVSDNIDFERIDNNIENGTLKALEMTSNCYDLFKSYSFFQHNDLSFSNWYTANHIGRRTKFTSQHVLAASAIPLFFPAVKIDTFYFGDGSLRLMAPLRACLKFDANKILVIGSRQIIDDMLAESHIETIGFSHILGNMFNSLFLDNLDRDIELVNHMNSIAELLSRWKMRRSPWRPIDICYMRPHFDVATIADNHYDSIPRLLRVLLNIMGAQSQSGDLLSFLLFESDFTGELIDLAYQETMARRHLIVDFFK